MYYKQHRLLNVLATHCGHLQRYFVEGYINIECQNDLIYKYKTLIQHIRGLRCL